MSVNHFLASSLGIMFAATVLAISLWRHADEQAYEQVVSESVQDILDAELTGVVDEISRESNTALPGEWGYYPKIIMDRIRLLTLLDFESKFRLMLEMGSERIEMAHELILTNQPRLAVKTANKGVHYLEEATTMLRQEELSREYEASYWALVYNEAVYQEQSLNMMKYGISDLAESTINGLCEQLMVLQGEAKSKMIVKAS